jgi:flagellar assembly factor FliW
MSSQVNLKPSDILSRVSPDNIVTFQKGLPGFPNDTRFVIIQNASIRPFAWLQSLDTPDLAFVVTSPFAFFPDYRPDVPDHDLAVLGSPPQEHVLILSILRVMNTVPPELHTNLKAPLIINLLTLAASQVILSNEAMYSEKAIYRVKMSPEELVQLKSQQAQPNP